MNSLEKVRELANAYSGPPDEDDGPLELALRTATMTVGPQFIAMLPDDPDLLDAGLVEMAAKLLELRSDDAIAELTIAQLTPGGLRAADLETIEGTAVDDEPAELGAGEASA